MGSTFKWVVVAVVSCAAGAAGGGYVMYTATTRLLISGAVDRDAVAIRRTVQALEQARAGSTEDAVETLESWLDDTLVVAMEPTNYEIRIDPVVLARADSAYMRARSYREVFPRSSSRSFVDTMIAAVWEAGPPSGLATTGR